MQPPAQDRHPTYWPVAAWPPSTGRRDRHTPTARGGASHPPAHPLTLPLQPLQAQVGGSPGQPCRPIPPAAPPQPVQTRKRRWAGSLFLDELFFFLEYKAKTHTQKTRTPSLRPAMGFTFYTLLTLRNSWAMVENKHHRIITPYVSIIPPPQHPHSYTGKIRVSQTLN